MQRIPRGRHPWADATLVHTAQACGKNPRDYLADVLIQLPGHKMSRIGELLPQNWLSPAERALPVAPAPPAPEPVVASTA